MKFNWLLFLVLLIAAPMILTVVSTLFGFELAVIVGLSMILVRVTIIGDKL